MKATKKLKTFLLSRYQCGIGAQGWVQENEHRPVAGEHAAEEAADHTSEG